MSTYVSEALLPDLADRNSCVLFYCENHFKYGPCDPASFINRLMTDFATQGTIVDDWIINMSPLYKSYRACIAHLMKHYPEKRAEAQVFQGVLVSIFGV